MEMVRLSNFFARAAHDPQLRPLVAELAMRGDPNGLGKAFGDVALNRRFEALEKKFEEKELKKQVDEAIAGQQRDRQALVDSGKYSAEQLADIEKLMTARGYHSYKDGAILYDSEHPAPPQLAETPTATWEFPTVEGRDGKMIPFDQFKKDPIAASKNAAYRVIDQFKLRTLPNSFSMA